MYAFILIAKIMNWSKFYDLSTNILVKIDTNRGFYLFLEVFLGMLISGFRKIKLSKNQSFCESEMVIELFKSLLVS